MKLKMISEMETGNFIHCFLIIVQINQYCKKGGKIDTQKKADDCIKKSIHEVACKLHNTSAVCKSNYIDPELIKFFTNDSEGFLRHFDVSSKEELYKKYVSFLDSLQLKVYQLYTIIVVWTMNLLFIS